MKQRCQTSLIHIGKTVLSIACKVGCGTKWSVGWIKIDQIASTCARCSDLEICHLKLRILKHSARCTQIFHITNDWILIPSEGNIELPTAVNPVQAVITGTIQVDEPCGTFNRGELCWLLGTYSIVMLLFVAMLLKRTDQRLHLIAYDLVGLDEPRISVEQKSRTNLEMEEDRTTTYEWLEVSLDLAFCWKS